VNNLDSCAAGCMKQTMVSASDNLSAKIQPLIGSL
jgi:hypothetical protein